MSTLTSLIQHSVVRSRQLRKGRKGRKEGRKKKRKGIQTRKEDVFAEDTIVHAENHQEVRRISSNKWVQQRHRDIRINKN